MATRDFREATLNEIRSNLVDEDTDWGMNWDAGIFSKKNNELESDLSNFDDYMRRRIELNEITLQRFNEIVTNVHDVEELYGSTFMSMEQEAHALDRILGRLNSEVSQDDFEKKFDATTFKNELLNLYPTTTRKLRELLAQGDLEGLKEFLSNVSEQDLATLSISGMTDEQRKSYYKEIYKRLRLDTLSENDRKLLQTKLRAMSKQDAMNLVYDTDGDYGGTQDLKMGISGKEMSEVKKFLCDKYGISQEVAEQMMSLFSQKGCGESSAVNTIFVEYMNRPEEFEKTFGFPLYNSSGKLNFNLLFADYCYSIYLKDGGEFNYGNKKNAQERLSEYLADKNIDADVEIEHTPIKWFFGRDNDKFVENIKLELAKPNTHVTICITPAVLYNTNGEIRGSAHFGNNDSVGHAASVTGFNENGDIIVSSYGEILIIKINELDKYDSLYFEVLSYDK